MPVAAFRVDASIAIGTGHVMRCLTLAGALQQRGFQCYFLCREHEGHLISLIRDKGYRVHTLGMPMGLEQSAMNETHPLLAHARWLGVTQNDDAAACTAVLTELRPAWLVVDHYALDVRWESSVRPHCGKIVAIDDLADRVHDCDLLLDQNLGRRPEDYDSLVPASCIRLIGPKYALLRTEFAQLREKSLARRKTGKFKRLLITLGGVDKDNVTGAVLAALAPQSLPDECEITIVMGPHAPWLEDVRQKAATLSWQTEVLVDVENMAELMANSDLAIGAAGATSWERCCLGLPAVLIILASNQRGAALALDEAGAATLLGEFNQWSMQQLSLVMENMSRCLQRYGSRASEICEGKGAALVTERVEALVW